MVMQWNIFIRNCYFNTIRLYTFVYSVRMTEYINIVPEGTLSVFVSMCVSVFRHLFFILFPKNVIKHTV